MPFVISQPKTVSKGTDGRYLVGADGDIKPPVKLISSLIFSHKEVLNFFLFLVFYINWLAAGNHSNYT